MPNGKRASTSTDEHREDVDAALDRRVHGQREQGADEHQRHYQDRLPHQ